MQLDHIDFSQLRISPCNMRYREPPPDVSDLLPSIRARGILEPLVIRPENGRYGVIAGRRRYFSAKALKQECGEIAPLPCAIMEEGDDAAAIEASLLENVARRDADPMREYETFVRLIKEGRTVDHIAATFGMTGVMVRQRLALGNLLPKIREAYRAEEIDAETIRHLTLASTGQQRKWLRLFADPNQYTPRGHQLKQWLFGGQEISTKAALFPLTDYTGQTVTDLFGETGYFADADLFWALQNRAVAAKREALLAKGWADVEVLEIGQRFAAWEHQKTPKAKGGKVFITVAHDGHVEIHDGYLSLKEARRARAKDKDETDTAAPKPVRPEVTAALQTYLDLHRHAAARAALLDHPGVALRLMLAHAIGGSGLWQVKREPQRAGSAAIAASLATSTAEATFEHRRGEVRALLGLSEADAAITGSGNEHGIAGLFARLLMLTDEDVLRVLAVVMGETLEAGSAVIETVGLHLKLDIGAVWQPDETFFELIRDRAVINAMLAEVAGETVAASNLAEKAKVQKQIIRDCLDGANGRTKLERWLPRWMEFPARGYTDWGGFRAADQSSRVASPVPPLVAAD